VRLVALAVSAQVERDRAVFAREGRQHAGVDPGALDVRGETVHGTMGTPVPRST
jgi:hypothetical protein